MDASSLLAGPRGRGLCLDVLADSWEAAGTPAAETAADALFRLDDVLDEDSTSSAFFAFEGEDGKPLSRLAVRSAKKKMLKQREADRRDPGPLLDTLARGIEASDLPTPSRDVLLGCLVQEAQSARYWQRPEGAERAAARPQVRAALARVAEHLAPQLSWMQAPLDRDQAWDHSGFEQSQASLTSVVDRLESTRDDLVAQERTRRPARSPEREVSGEWWSMIGFSPRTTGLVDPSLPWGSGAMPGPLGLHCEEDEYRDDEPVLLRRLSVEDADRILEIRHAEDWVGLCTRFPLDVTKLYRGNWYLNTGRDSLHPSDGTEPGWVIPDLAAASQAYDGIHLSIAAYLELAGRVVPVEGHGATMVAGFSPDQTVWLTDRTCVQTVTWQDDETDQ